MTLREASEPGAGRGLPHLREGGRRGSTESEVASTFPLIK